ncbi:MAG: hypothetical protein AB1657_05160 [Candidatus Micrarchaeota archaeon]
MAQESKEEKPPEAPEEISKLAKYKTEADINPRALFWEIAAAYAEKKDIAEIVKKNAKRREALVNVGATVLGEEERTYHVKMPKARIAECLLEMVLAGGWKDALERLLENLYDRRRGPDLNMMLAFGKGAGSMAELVEWVRGLLAEGRPPEAVLAYVARLGDRGIVEKLKEQLMHIAKSEINEPQLYALEALSVMVKGDAQVRKVFVDLMDDWDVRAKKVVLENLMDVEDEAVGKKAVAAYVYEFDPYSRNLLREIIKKNKDAAKAEIGKYAGKYNEKVNRELVELVEAVYGKKAAKEIIGEQGSGKPEAERRDAPAELP